MSKVVLMEFSAEESAFNQRIRDVYNSGDCGRAVELAKEFLDKFPNSPLALYNYAVMHGDYSYSPEHTPEEKKRLLEIAKKGISDLFNHPQLQDWPIQFQIAVKNEYFWFFELHLEQYQLGIEEVMNGRPGHYSACVGASMLAYKRLEQSIEDAEDWAKRSVYHFKEFEKSNPNWYNINIFAAQALACMGQYEEALTCFKDQFRKQGKAEDAKKIGEFLDKIDRIKKLRGDEDKKISNS